MTVLLAVGVMTGVAQATVAGARLPLRRCAPDAVVAGTVCLDRYESSVWRVPNPTTTNASLARRIRQGKATRAELISAGATQLGTRNDDYAPCRDDGQNCRDDIYAVSLPSVVPSAFVTWFQAQEACANAGKRLPTNAEWQVGVNGTPDPGPDDGTSDCNTDGALLSPTAARRDCVSTRGAFDMVGNLAEWVADWVPRSTQCQLWGGGADDDVMCLVGASTTATAPGALVRGGFYFFLGPFAGPLTVGTDEPFNGFHFIGFRCAR
jgi:formylglycine-generating enzyme required for sulfatase activity